MLNARADTLHVGPQAPISHIRDAARIAKDGDTIEIQPGIYRADTAVWTQDELTIRGTGDGVILDAAGTSAEGKAIWVIRGGRIRIENITFRGTRVRDGNGAGIRFEGRDLTVVRCRFMDNENGILTGNDTSTRLRIEDSVFGPAPQHPGRLHHELYVGRIASFEIEGSRFSGGFHAHLLKSRARRNLIRYNWLDDGPDGQAAYELEFPNGGVAVVVGNRIGQSARTTNMILVRHGAEGLAWANNHLIMAHNTLISRTPLGTLVQVDHPSQTGVRLEANLFIGTRRLAVGTDAALADNAFLPRTVLATARPTDWFAGAPVLPNAISDPTLLPIRQFTAPIGERPVPADTPRRAGAAQIPP